MWHGASWTALPKRFEKLMGWNSLHSIAAVIHGCWRRTIALTLLPQAIQDDTANNEKENEAKGNCKSNKNNKN